ncbi:hypothetical protein D3H65_11510 [Paraflavitalea soli]|uniref:Uncharacterized protein n=1 Tax=Paraflavitalea soli TaxID=2315862 RepID=A0A3B7MLI2_9BACT|nr:glycosyltransferase [Paraflavitalea soli]AXY74567.1 hypothetical protein D3H65_11510 [Paraflavitalea soli]
MAIIAFLIDNKEGHIIPSIKLAFHLKERGHDIVYLSVTDNEAIIKEQGFAFHAVFTDVYPKGFNESNKRNMDEAFDDAEIKSRHLYKLMEGELDTFFAAVKPDLFIISSFLNIEILLLHYKYGIRPLLLTTYLRKPGAGFVQECIDTIMDLPGDTAGDIIGFAEGLGIDFTSLQDLLLPLNELHELILCPAELEMELITPNDKVHYTGPSIWTNRRGGEIPDWSAIKPGAHIIYGSLGSYAVSYGAACAQFFVIMMQVMRHKDLQGHHLILSVGNEFDTRELGIVPDNVTLMRWTRQTEVLQRASLVVTHGGLGSIKESVYYGVPMIVFPIRYDQVRNATLVDYHKLGLRGHIEALSEEDMRTKILYVLKNDTIRRNIKKMQLVFEEKEKEQIGVAVAERMLPELVAPHYRSHVS